MISLKSYLNLGSEKRLSEESVKPDDLSSIPRIHMTEKQTNSD